MRQVNLVVGFNSTGVGTLAESYFLGLREICAKQNLPIVARHYDANPKTIERLVRRQHPDDTTVFFWLTDPKILASVRTRRALWMMFESTRLPSAWIAHLAHYHQVWVSSGWGHDVLRANGYSGDVRVLAAGVNAQIFVPRDREPVWEPGKRSLRILMVGKLERRKGYDIALEALARLSKQIKLTLVAKADYFMFPDRAAQLGRVAESMGVECELVSGKLTSAALAQLYRSCDLFLFPSRAEGFGLPCIEALASGLPTMAVHYSGPSVFLDAIAGLFREIRFEMVPLVDDDYSRFYRSAYGQEPLGEWAEPSVDSIVEGVLAMASDYPAWLERARKAASIIRDQFDWQRVARNSLPYLSSSP
jgi:glycosyltransferase involved in cell wall biosynthesis